MESETTERIESEHLSQDEAGSGVEAMENESPAVTDDLSQEFPPSGSVGDPPPSQPAAPTSQGSSPLSGVTAAQMQILTIRGSRLGRIVDLVGLLRGVPLEDLIDLLQCIDVGKVGGLLTAIKEAMAFEGGSDKKEIMARAAAYLRVVRIWTEITPGIRDDAMLDWLDNVLNRQPLLETVADVIAGLFRKVQPEPGGIVVMSAAALSVDDVGAVLTGPQSKQLRLASLDWGLLLAIGKAVIEMWLRSRAINVPSRAV